MLPPLAAVVLCGGASQRMGTEKALMVMPEGLPLVLHVAGRMATVADPVLLATGRPGRLGRLGYLEVEDPTRGAGPLAGIVAALERSPHDLLAVVAVDMPFASPRLFEHLASSIGAHDACVPRTAHGLEPLHALYARSTLPHLRACLDSGRLAVHQALADLAVREVAEAEWDDFDPDGRFAANLNEPEDLAAVRQERESGTSV